MLKQKKLTKVLLILILPLSLSACAPNLNRNLNYNHYPEYNTYPTTFNRSLNDNHQRSFKEHKVNKVEDFIGGVAETAACWTIGGLAIAALF
jgi:hypothetical protein